MNTSVVTVRGEQIPVRALTWKESLAISKKLGESLFLGGITDSEGKVTFERIGAIIASSEVIASEIFALTTGRDTGWVDSLSARDALGLLDVILKQNLDEELFQTAKNLGGRLGAYFFERSKQTVN